MTKKYFIRTEESYEQAEASLQRKQSIRRWALAGCSPWEHLAFAIPFNEQHETLESYYNSNIGESEVESLIHNELFHDSDDKKLIQILNLTQLKDGGYAEFLPGLCALDSFPYIPEKSEITEEDIEEYPFAYVICYEGETVDIDPDEGWELFIPTRIIWIKETGKNEKRDKMVG